jgi:hypothetical protein
MLPQPIQISLDARIAGYTSREVHDLGLSEELDELPNTADISRAQNV